MNTSSPRVTIILPCRNEKGNIEECVRSILNQKPPVGGFELLITDGLSDDGTRSILERLSLEYQNIRILENIGRIVSTGLNIGIKEAKGMTIMRMDAHTKYANDYLIQCLATLERTNAHNVGGPCQAKGYTRMGRAIAAAFQSRFAVGGSKNHNLTYEGEIDTVYLGCWPRELFSEIGLFDEELVRNQDDEFNLRARKAGKMLWQSPKIKCIYHTRETLKKLFLQYLQYSYWKLKVIRKHKRPASIRHLIPSTFLLTLVFLPAISIWAPLATWAWGGVLVTYGICTLFASVLTAYKYEWGLLPFLPMVFFTYHIAYGIGFLWGIWDFIILKKKANPSNEKITR